MFQKLRRQSGERNSRTYASRSCACFPPSTQSYLLLTNIQTYTCSLLACIRWVASAGLNVCIAGYKNKPASSPTSCHHDFLLRFLQQVPRKRACNVLACRRIFSPPLLSRRRLVQVKRRIRSVPGTSYKIGMQAGRHQRRISAIYPSISEQGLHVPGMRPGLYLILYAYATAHRGAFLGLYLHCLV
jgi:hypothetical protein